MKGLVLKDINSLVTELKYIALLLVALIFLQNDFMYIFVIVYMAVLPISALGYDERAKWDKMANMLPFTTAQLVGSKYILGYLAMGSATLIVVLSRCLGSGKTVSAEDFISTAIVLCIALVIEAIQLPLMFWVGVEKGRILFILITVFGASILYSSGTILEEISNVQTGKNVLFILAAAAAVCNLVSFLAAEKLYQRAK